MKKENSKENSSPDFLLLAICKHTHNGSRMKKHAFKDGSEQKKKESKRAHTYFKASFVLREHENNAGRNLGSRALLLSCGTFSLKHIFPTQLFPFFLLHELKTFFFRASTLCTLKLTLEMNSLACYVKIWSITKGARWDANEEEVSRKHKAASNLNTFWMLRGRLKQQISIFPTHNENTFLMMAFLFL